MPNALTIRGAKGDMLKSVYDTDKDGTVDNSEKLEQETKTQVQDHTPKSHTHEESQISDLDHDAQKIKGVIIDDSAKADQKVLAYDHASQNIVYIDQAPPGAILNSVQYGSITINDFAVSNTTTIISVDTSKSIVFFLGSYGTKYSCKYDCARLELQDSTTVIAIRNSGGESAYTTINFCVIEFSSGIASVQQAVVTIPSSSTQADQTISEIDVSKSLLFFLALTTPYDGEFYSDVSPLITLLNSTTVRANKFDALYETVAGFAVLEFS